MTFLEKATALKPILNTRRVYPLKESVPKEDLKMRCGEGFTLDFGEHLVGHITLFVKCTRAYDSAPDSPLEVHFQFAEVPLEFEEGPYTGSLSSSWFQTETVKIDNPFEPIILPRRYAFRYLKITFPANTGYWASYKDCYVDAITSADVNKLEPLPEGTDPFIKKIDDVACNTLRDCMLYVFEDGPKRDRRLWLGDLYLQAKANYVTFKNYDLVLRCLYLFAGLPHEDGTLSSAVYYEPWLLNQDWIIHDYALFFIGCLADYYRETKDINVVKELWPTCIRQTEIVMASSENFGGPFNQDYYFVDWCEPLDKTIAAQGLVISMLREALFLSELLEDNETSGKLAKDIEACSKVLLSFFDEKQNLFVTKDGQISVHSQMWAVLSGSLSKEMSSSVLETLLKREDAIKTVTPYAMHYLVEALFESGLQEIAMEKVKDYWGGMVKLGADTFWEVYVPGNPTCSPYNDVRMNSFCHAWSCTATYFIRRKA